MRGHQKISKEPAKEPTVTEVKKRVPSNDAAIQAMMEAVQYMTETMKADEIWITKYEAACTRVNKH